MFCCGSQSPLSYATPFFFWASNEGTFEDVVDYRESYASFTFPANPGTGGRDVYLVMGVGDGLGQVDRVRIPLKGNDADFIAFEAFDAQLQLPMIADIMPLDLPPGRRFSDVTDDHWARDFIYDMYRRNLIAGRPDGTFGANDPRDYIRVFGNGFPNGRDRSRSIPGITIWRTQLGTKIYSFR
ncbi:MAG: S-layer homology domain-containing protein [Defluviitaleaceae bacterium]|nr:S-layer homology domain-containing protein [Defluviitaleaceae bacterium]